jgi:hypothetical protein
MRVCHFVKNWFESSAHVRRQSLKMLPRLEAPKACVEHIAPLADPCLSVQLARPFAKKTRQSVVAQLCRFAARQR